jgi:cleavage and polyadenylation specificity factor subunit 1
MKRLCDMYPMLVSDGSERQIIKDMDGTVPRAKIKACSICDPYVLIVREDDTIGLFIDAQRGRVRRKDMSPMGDKVIFNLPYPDIRAHVPAWKASRYLAGCFFSDTSDLFQTQLVNHGAANATKGVTTAQTSMITESPSQWLVLVRPQGIMEVRADSQHLKSSDEPDF